MPRILVYNPGHEEALKLAPGAAYTPPRIVRRMMADLSLLRCHEAGNRDLIFVPTLSGDDFRLYNSAGEPTAPTEIVYDLDLWAAEPHTAVSVKRILSRRGIRIRLPRYPSALPQMAHRRMAAECLKLLDAAPELIPLWVKTSEELSAAIRHFMLAMPGLSAVVLKHPYTCSGRGIRILPLPLDEQSVKILCRSKFQEYGFSIEPYWAVQENWAIEWYCKASGEVSYCALSLFRTSEGGYTGNLMMPQVELEQRMMQILGGESSWREFLSRMQRTLSRLLCGYEGYLGVDMFTYRHPSGKLKLHPCVEINVRSTMGLMAHQIYQSLHLTPQHRTFKLLCASSPEALRQDMNAVQKTEGYRALTPVCEQTCCHAYIVSST